MSSSQLGIVSDSGPVCSLTPFGGPRVSLAAARELMGHWATSPHMAGFHCYGIKGNWTPASRFSAPSSERRRFRIAITHQSRTRHRRNTTSLHQRGAGKEISLTLRDQQAPARPPPASVGQVFKNRERPCLFGVAEGALLGPAPPQKGIYCPVPLFAKQVPLLCVAARLIQTNADMVQGA